jgi:uncharacterized damage-inducible protein DinB
MRQTAVINHLIQQLREIYNGKLWMGDTFQKKIHSITGDEAFTRPLPNLHSPAELISHLTAWRKDAISKIQEGKGQLLDTSPSNWMPNSELMKIGWRQLIQEYEESLLAIIDLLQNKSDTFLEEKYEDQDYQGVYNYSFLVNGILHHDLYHLGQLGIVIKLIKE